MHESRPTARALSASGAVARPAGPVLETSHGFAFVAIEPVTSPAKSEGLLERNHLAGARGDAINAILVGAGHDIRLLLAWLRRFLSFFLALIVPAHSPSTTCERSS